MLQKDILKNRVEHLYAHIPFCRCICAYCDFYKLKYQENAADQFVYAFHKEVENKLLNPNLKTIYLGGGTPSALNEEQLETILSVLDPYRSQVEEYTIECNPESITKEKLDIMVKYGVNRISLGVQSFDDRLQNIMERICPKQQILDVIEMIYQNGITNISADFIYGLPTQTLEMWENDLLEIVQNPYISHLSLYSLTIEKNTKFQKLGYKPANSELETLMYDKAIEILLQHGFEQYEIASFTKNKKYSRHNLSYWSYKDFYGLGPGASGKEDLVRYDNERNLLNYNRFQFNKNLIPLSLEDNMFEHIMMNLRVKWGINIDEFNEIHHINLLEKYSKPIQKYIDKKWLEIKDGYLKTTYEGMFALHDILVDFLGE